MTKGYCVAAAVAAVLGRVFTSPDTTQATAMIGAAEAMIDRITNRAWMVASPIANELHVIDGPLGSRSDVLTPRIVSPPEAPGFPSAPVFLNNKPVTAVTGVIIRLQSVGASDIVLAGTDYELIDAASGILTVNARPGYLAKVSYTHSGPAVPADISHACAVLAGSLMSGYFNPQSAAYKRISVGSGDVSVEFRDLDANAIPGVVLTILDSYKRPFVFA